MLLDGTCVCKRESESFISSAVLFVETCVFVRESASLVVPCYLLEHVFVCLSCVTSWHSCVCVCVYVRERKNFSSRDVFLAGVCERQSFIIGLCSLLELLCV